ncbi:MAG: hypothetical protein LAP40_11570 [Acidobacteriia bacterium]|nr:hypothetical protein [Terriglobia bacterium]
MSAFRLACFAVCTGILAASPRIQFEQNRGQTDARVRYLARTPQGLVFFNDSGMVLSRPDATPVTFEWVGADPQAGWEALEGTGETTSYHVGRDPRRWADQVPEYGRLARRGLYPGIDAVYYGAGRQLEYDLFVAPGADPGRIRIRIRGARRIWIGRNGDLVIATEGGAIRQQTPGLYQTAADGSRTAVAGRFRLLGRSEVGFVAGRYDHTKVLAIDPTLESSTYLGGSGDDEVVFASGTISAGNTTSSDFPDAAVARRSGTDVFYRSGTSTLIFGGSGDDRLTGVVLVGAAPVLIGYTNSTDLPTSASSVQPNFAGGASDGFFLYFSRTSTGAFTTINPVISYLGTTGEDRITAGTTATFQSLIFLTGWTTTHGFNPGAVATTMVAGPGGGVDGFLVTAVVLPTADRANIQGAYLNSVTYFGGSGDDRPSSIAASADRLNCCLIGGETTSTDFPGLVGASTARAGASDGFVIRYNYPSSANSLVSRLYGGNGTDRISGVAAMLDGSVVVAGTTTSTDLPLAGAAQAQFGGGASDAFVARFSADLSQLTYASYWGGAGADEATSISANPLIDEFFIGGWTASPDFPVTNAVQPTYGGGPDDGFLVHYDPDGKVYEATFLGGSGSDQILSVAAGSAFEVTVAGETSSADFPLQGATQTQLRGNSDGFVSTIGAKLVAANPVTGSKGLRAYAGLVVPLAPPPVTFTLSSSDPASVLLASDTTSAAAASITTTAINSNAANYFVDCLANGASADIRITAPGYPQATAHVDCVLPSVFGFWTGGTISLWSGPATISLELVAVSPSNPASRNTVFARLAADQIAVQVQNSDPSVATVSTTTLSLGASTGSARLTVSPLSVGSTDLTLESPSLQPLPGNTVQVVVANPYYTYTPAPIPGGFQAAYSVALLGTAPAGVSVSFTSGDPSRLLVSSDATKTGAASVATSGRVNLQALASSGSVPLSIAVTGFPPVTVPVSLTTPVLTVSSNLIAAPALVVGQPVTASASFGYSPNPGSGTTVTAKSSDPSVVEVSPSSVVLNSAVPSFQVAGVAAGSAVLTFSSSIGAPVSISPLTVTVAHRTLKLGDLSVGKNLVGAELVTWPSELAAGESVTITSSDPSRVLLGTSNTVPGKARITVTAKGGAKIYVFGLADSGTVQITATAAGFLSMSRLRSLRTAVDGPVTATATVTLTPSGFGWHNDSLSSSLSASTVSAAISAFALDPRTLIPIAEQTLQPGLTVALPIVSDHADVVVPVSSPVSVPSPGSGASVSLRNVGVGGAKVTVSQPAGFTQPASRQSLGYHVVQ